MEEPLRQFPKESRYHVVPKPYHVVMCWRCKSLEDGDPCGIRLCVAATILSGDMIILQDLSLQLMQH